MNKRVFKIILAVVILCTAVPIVAYLATSAYLGYRLYSAVDSSFQSKGRDYKEYVDFIGRIHYQTLDYSGGLEQEWETNRHSFPLVIHNFNTAKAYYRYTFLGSFSGGEDIPVTISLKRRDGGWYVTDVTEPY